jgi:hypothetical protein
MSCRRAATADVWPRHRPVGAPASTGRGRRLTPPQVFAALLIAAAALAVAGVRGGWLRPPTRRVKHDDLDAQIAADFAPQQRAEARAIVDAVLAHARPDDEKLVWRNLLDGCRGNLEKLRRVQPKAIASLAKVYRLLGNTLDRTPPAD